VPAIHFAGVDTQTRALDILVVDALDQAALAVGHHLDVALGLIGDLQALLEQLVGLQFSRARVLTQKVHHCAELSSLDVLDRYWQEDLPPLGAPARELFFHATGIERGRAEVISETAVCSKNDLDVKETVNLWAGSSAAVKSMLGRCWNECAKARDYLCLACRHAEPGWL
jgi:hypothetical protein